MDEPQHETMSESEEAAWSGGSHLSQKPQQDAPKYPNWWGIEEYRAALTQAREALEREDASKDGPCSCETCIVVRAALAAIKTSKESEHEP